MSEHTLIVRDYVGLRNFLAKSNPQPNMAFEVHFKVEGSSLMAFNTLTKAKVELARVQPQYFRLYMPHYGCTYEYYCLSLIKFINKNLGATDLKEVKSKIVELAHKHKGTLNLGTSYEPS